MNDGPTLQCWSTTIHCLVSPTLLVVTQDISNKNMRGQILREQFIFVGQSVSLWQTEGVSLVRIKRKPENKL